MNRLRNNQVSAVTKFWDSKYSSTSGNCLPDAQSGNNIKDDIMKHLSTWIVCAVMALFFIHSLSASAHADTARFEPKNSINQAADIGVGPGARISGVGINNPEDVDWYKFTVLRPDSLVVRVAYDRTGGELVLELFDHAGQAIDQGEYDAEGAAVEFPEAIPGAYHIRVSGADAATKAYILTIEPGADSSTRIIYVNDSSDADLVYASFARGQRTYVVQALHLITNITPESSKLRKLG